MLLPSKNTQQNTTTKTQHLLLTDTRDWKDRNLFLNGFLFELIQKKPEKQGTGAIATSCNQKLRIQVDILTGYIWDIILSNEPVLRYLSDEGVAYYEMTQGKHFVLKNQI